MFVQKSDVKKVEFYTLSIENRLLPKYNPTNPAAT